MATRYNKDKYAQIKGLKNEPLSNLAANSKKRKVGEEKGETVVLPTTTLGHSHNMITDGELKGLSSIPSHELFNCHIHKLV